MREANRASVSVIVPCWRCADTVGRAVESIAAQTLMPEEVLLVDDASGDGTRAALDQLSARYPKDWVRAFSMSRNGGPGAARNLGWDNARGKYVAFLDADDAWHPDKIALQADWMERHPDVALSGHGTTLYSPEKGAPVATLGEPRAVSLADMLVSNRFPTRSVMVRRDLGLRFEGKEVTEDYLLWLQAVSRGATCVCFSPALAFSFRAEYSHGGYSSNLWRHERRELRALARLRQDGGLSPLTWAAASAWSLVKYVRRLALTRLKPAMSA